MAASKVVSRLSSRLKPSSFKLNNISNNPNSPLFSTLKPNAAPPLSPSSRLPVQLSCLLGSMLPLHNAIASARLVSSLSSDSKCWTLVPQGISMPL